MLPDTVLSFDTDFVILTPGLVRSIGSQAQFSLHSSILSATSGIIQFLPAVSSINWTGVGSSQISIYFGCEDIATVLLPSLRVISSFGGGALDSGSYIDYGVVSFRPDSSLSSSVTFQVLNAGSGPLSFSTTPYLTGDSSSFLISSSTFFPPVLLPGQAGHITVLFAPTADISASAELNILSNDPATNAFVIHLRGKSVNVHCSVPIVSKSSVAMTGNSIALTGCFDTSLPP